MPAQESRLYLRTFASRAVNSHIWPKPGQIWGTHLGGKERIPTVVEGPAVCSPTLRHSANGGYSMDRIPAGSPVPQCVRDASRKTCLRSTTQNRDIARPKELQSSGAHVSP